MNKLWNSVQSNCQPATMTVEAFDFVYTSAAQVSVERFRETLKRFSSLEKVQASFEYGNRKRTNC